MLSAGYLQRLRRVPRHGQYVRCQCANSSACKCGRTGSKGQCVNCTSLAMPCASSTLPHACWPVAAELRQEHLHHVTGLSGWAVCLARPRDGGGVLVSVGKGGPVMPCFHLGTRCRSRSSGAAFQNASQASCQPSC